MGQHVNQQHFSSVADGIGPVDIGEQPEREALEQAWTEIRAGLRRAVGVRLFDQWIRPLRLGSFCAQSGTLDIEAPSEFAASYVSSNFATRIALAWRTTPVGVHDLRIVRASEAPETVPVTPRGFRPQESTARPGQSARALASSQDASTNRESAGRRAAQRFEPRHDFAGFMTDESNVLAASAAKAMAGATRPAFNPLFIHGPTGFGKTHLLHAIAQAYGETLGGSTGAPPREGAILYMSAERFMNEFVAAIRANDTFSFKARLREARMLLVDDIQFIAGKGPTQEEFLHTLNDLIDAGARIAIAADRPPQQLGSVDPRILSRLAGGLVADIQPAGLELRMKILEARREAVADIAVPDDVIALLAGAIRTSIRELEGAFNKLVAYAQLVDKAITTELAQSMLAESLRASHRRITIDEIQKLCAAHYRIDQSEMRSQRRARAVARPRQVAMYLAKKLTPRSLPEIGRVFGGRDHSTVIHAVKTIEAMRLDNPEMDADIRTLQKQLEG
ncbi:MULTISPECIES: chromosomal replication initiator protein DnaA [unclassified Sphingobium]|uniref:chromosomal replication initiator protein DnaA n=1 Tax=unclassified Sphingobium TaxID=2611147 RepID=UPI002225B030|nr:MULTISPECIES: chromosomal replication initiator protein DnaA [unclassified Sphingobium]MCW2383412.1 chromosomal replication initiator protein [Sphingobium sp. B2D3B]